jgi:hypothetical protein
VQGVCVSVRISTAMKLKCRAGDCKCCGVWLVRIGLCAWSVLAGGLKQRWMGQTCRYDIRRGKRGSYLVCVCTVNHEHALKLGLEPARGNAGAPIVGRPKRGSSNCKFVLVRGRIHHYWDRGEYWGVVGAEEGGEAGLGRGDGAANVLQEFTRRAGRKGREEADELCIVRRRAAVDKRVLDDRRGYVVRAKEAVEGADELVMSGQVGVWRDDKSSDVHDRNESSGL